MLSVILSIAFLLGGANQDAIENYLRANLIDYAKFEYRVINPQIFEGKDYTIDYSRNFLLKNRYGYIPVILKNGKYGERTFIRVNLKLYKKVLVAERRIRRGEKVTPADFKEEVRDVSTLRGVALTDYSQIADARTRLNIREDAILTADMVEKNDDIFAGEKITAVYVNGSVAVSFPVIARSGGRKGETIRVQRNDGIIFKAKIVNEKEVTILE